jgi:hypothetical protein
MKPIPENHLPHYDIRPRFRYETDIKSSEITDKIKAALKAEGCPCKGSVHPGYATLYLPMEEQHYWSPQLSLTVEEDELGTLIRGLYAPRPAVWTMFVFFYSFIGFAALIISIVGLSNWSLNKSAAILWFVPLLGLIFLSIYLVAYFGQRTSIEQMIKLHRFLEESTGLTIDAHNNPK